MKEIAIILKKNLSVSDCKKKNTYQDFVFKTSSPVVV